MLDELMGGCVIKLVTRGPAGGGARGSAKPRPDEHGPRCAVVGNPGPYWNVRIRDRADDGWRMIGWFNHASPKP